MATNQLNTVIRHLRRATLLRDGAGLTDGQLLEYFVSRRDDSAFEGLLRRHGPMVLGVCRRVLRNAADAEDAFQATFLVLVRKAATLQSRELVGNWLYGVAYRTALEARGAIFRRRTKERQVREMPETEAPGEEAWHELRPLLDRELSRLPDKYRVPIIFCDLEGKTRREAARQLKLPEGTLSGRLTIARRMLAKRLARCGLTLSAPSLAVILCQNAASAGVPRPLLISTAKAAVHVAAGQTAAAGVISAKVAALTEGVLRTMLLTKLKTTAVLLLAAATLSLSVSIPMLPVLQANVLSAEKAATPEPAAHEQKAKPESGKDKGPEKKDAEKPGEVRRFEGPKDFSYCAVFSPDGSQVLSCGGGEYKDGQWLPGEQDYTVWLWDVANGKNLRRFEGHTNHVSGVAFSADGSRALTGSLDSTLRLWDVKTGNSLGIYEGHSERINDIAFSKDGRRGLSGSGDGTVRWWDLDSGKELQKLEGHNSWIWTVALSPDGKYALSGGVDKVCRLWDLENGQEVRQFEGHTADVRRVAFSPDGKLAASASFDNTVRLWSVDSGKELHTLEGHTGGLQGVTFTPDGRRLVSSGFDGMLRIWEVQSGQELARFEHQGGPLHFVAVAPDGRHAVTTGFDHSVRLWRLPEAAKR